MGNVRVGQPVQLAGAAESAKRTSILMSVVHVCFNHCASFVCDTISRRLHGEPHDCGWSATLHRGLFQQRHVSWAHVRCVGILVFTLSCKYLSVCVIQYGL